MKKRIVILLALLLGGCAPAQNQVQRYFWPAGATEPKIEYLGFLQSDRDLQRGAEAKLADAILGLEAPRLLFKRPHGVAAGSGKVLVTDPGQADVLLLDRQGRTVHSLGQINARSLRFEFPYGVEAGADGTGYVTDSQKKKVYVFGSDGVLRASFGSDILERPTGLAVDDARGRLYVVDTGAHRLAVFSTAGESLGTIGRRGGGEGEFNYPLDVAVDGEGNLYVVDSVNCRIQVLTPEGKFLRAFGERGTAVGSFMLPKGIDVSPSGHVYVSDSQANRFIIFGRQGEVLLTIGGRYAIEGGKVAPGGLYLPQGIDVDSEESIWIVDSINRMVHQFQYLNGRYLAEHPILPGEAYIPPQED